MQAQLDLDEGEVPLSRYDEEFEELSIIGKGGGGVVCLARHKGMSIIFPYPLCYTPLPF